MANFIGIMIVWLLIYVFLTGSLVERMSLGKTFLYSQLFNVASFVLATGIWFATASDGFSQVFGSFIFAGVSGAAMLVTAVWLLVMRKKAKGLT